MLDMTVEDAVDFFENVPSIRRKIETLNEVGLSYVKLGQHQLSFQVARHRESSLQQSFQEEAQERLYIFLMSLQPDCILPMSTSLSISFTGLQRVATL